MSRAKFSYLTIFCLFFTSHLWASDQSRTYAIKSSLGHCSATLVKVDNKCHLVTNAHCLNHDDQPISIKSASNYMTDYRDGHAEIQEKLPEVNQFYTKNSIKADFLWRFERKFFSEKENQSLTTKILNIDRSKDLALLEVPNEIKINTCRELKNLKEISDDHIRDKYLSVIISGFTHNRKNTEPQPKVWYNRSTHFTGSDKAPIFVHEAVTVESSLLKNIDHFYVAHKIKMLPGNSGGMAQDEKGYFLGITTRYHPTQDRAYIIPSMDVVDFIKNPTHDETSIIIDFKTLPTGDGGGTNGGDGGGTNGGDGGGTNGGDGGGTNGGDSCGNSFQNFHIFMEPLEGIVTDTGEILLSLAGHQIDGLDDLKDHGELKGEIIKRDADGYPSLEIRKNILERLAGSYEFNHTHKFYRHDPSHVQEWNEAFYGTGVSAIDVDTNKISIDLPEHHMHQTSEQFFITDRSYEVDKNKMKFKVSYSDDYKKVYLKKGNRILECDNKNYLKLICTGDKYSFSLSADSLEKTKHTRFRFIDFNSKNSKNYFYSH